MKKVLLVAVSGLFVLASCKKSYSCECTSVSSLATTEKTGKGKNATDACNDAADKVLGMPTEVCSPK